MDAYSAGPVAPLRDELSSDDDEGAYAVQSICVREWLARGRRIVGRKIGLTSKAVQAQLGVGQPDYGVLFDDMQVADGGSLAPSRLLQPKVEAEIALILAKDLDEPNATSHDVLSAAACALPAIEIVDSRIKDWKISFADTVADNASSGAFVIGAEARALAGLDLFSCGMVMEIDGTIASIGVGAACLGHPLNAAAWLARTLASRGDPLKAGDIVLTGALGPMATLRPGVQVQATIGGLGRVRFRFEESGH
jgi:2-keto-4-pentenoate hydratase